MSIEQASAGRDLRGGQAACEANWREGYRAGILQTTAMGRPIYEGLGFVEVDRYPQYRWTP